MTNEQIKFINDIGTAAAKYYNEYKILPSLVVAMAIKKSGWGKSKLASKNHNYFGMKWTTKCGTKWVEYNTKEFVDGKYVTVKAKFRSYDTIEEGIQGFYKFITGYKRYANLIGETGPAVACTKIQADGWATAPNYDTSLYNDYIIKYDLTKFDKLDPVDDTKPYYIKGKVYLTGVNLHVRHTPNGIKKKPYEVTVNAKVNGYCDHYGNFVLNAGTRVTCLDVVKEGNSIWLLIPSGYICAVTSGGSVYIS